MSCEEINLYDVTKMDPLMTYYEEFYDDNCLAEKGVPFMTDDVLLDEWLPDDTKEVEKKGKTVVRCNFIPPKKTDAEKQKDAAA